MQGYFLICQIRLYPNILPSAALTSNLLIYKTKVKLIPNLQNIS